MAHLAAELNKLRVEAGLTYREMQDPTKFHFTTLSRATAGKRLPTLPVLRAFVEACGGDVGEWEQQWYAAHDISSALEEHATTTTKAPGRAAAIATSTLTLSAAVDEQPPPSISMTQPMQLDRSMWDSVAPRPLAHNQVRTFSELADQLRVLAARKARRCGSCPMPDSLAHAAVIIRLLLVDSNEMEVASCLQIPLPDVRQMQHYKLSRFDWRTAEKAVYDFVYTVGQSHVRSSEWARVFTELHAWNPDPNVICTRAQLYEAMAEAKRRSWLSFNDISRASDGLLSRSSVHALVTGAQLPRADQAVRILSICGIRVDEAWRDAIDRAVAAPEVHEETARGTSDQRPPLLDDFSARHAAAWLVFLTIVFGSSAGAGLLISTLSWPLNIVTGAALYPAWLICAVLPANLVQSLRIGRWADADDSLAPSLRGIAYLWPVVVVVFIIIGVVAT